MLELYSLPYIKGFTTNPTLMRKSGIHNYRAFAQDILQCIPDRPVSFEVFSDEFDEMERQAHEISGWGSNVCVKIPVTNTRCESSLPLIQRLSRSSIHMNITALMTLDQVNTVADNLVTGTPAYISVFAGRIADTGRDPLPIMSAAAELLKGNPSVELIWASPREVLNIFQADMIGCDIITVTNDILKKLPLVGKDLEEYSLETVQMFYRDAQAAGYYL
jgi:transaldolase